MASSRRVDSGREQDYDVHRRMFKGLFSTAGHGHGTAQVHSRRVSAAWAVVCSLRAPLLDVTSFKEIVFASVCLSVCLSVRITQKVVEEF